jgi:hypothetical protein
MADCCRHHGASNLATQEDYTILSTGNLSPPSLDQLSVLTAVPSGSVTALNAHTRSGKQIKRKPLVKEGAIVGRFFNPVAGRPYPNNGISLFQGVTAELTTNGVLMTTSTVVDVKAALSFALSAFNGYTNFTSLFDQYRFDQLEVWIEPVNTTTAVFGVVATAIDLDDANTPGTFVSVADHQGALIGEGQGGRYHKWKPHMAVATYSGAFTSYGNMPAGWIDAASPSVQHFGLKAAAGTSGVAVQYNYAARAVVSFRAPGIN